MLNVAGSIQIRMHLNSLLEKVNVKILLPYLDLPREEESHSSNHPLNLVMMELINHSILLSNLQVGE